GERPDCVARRQFAADDHAGVQNLALVADLDVDQPGPRMDFAIAADPRIALDDHLRVDHSVAPDLDRIVDVGRIRVNYGYAVGHQTVDSLVAKPFPHRRQLGARVDAVQFARVLVEYGRDSEAGFE